MNARCHIVDPSRIRLLLADDLSEAEKAELELHLETCEACSGVIERLSADTGWWEEARRFVPADLGPAVELQPEDTADHRPDSHHNGSRSARHGDVWLDFLAPSDDPRSLGRLGPYEVMSVIGQGGMGIVLKAFDSALDRAVALKVLAPQLAASGAARRRFAREARAAAAVVHEHVVAIHAVNSWRGLPYLVMQHVPGHSLQERIDRDGPLEIEDVLRIGMQAAAGLAAAACAGPGTSRREAVQHPAGTWCRAGQADRLRTGPGRGRRERDSERSAGRHAPVHGAGASQWRRSELSV